MSHRFSEVTFSGHQPAANTVGLHGKNVLIRGFVGTFYSARRLNDHDQGENERVASSVIDSSTDR